MCIGVPIRCSLCNSHGPPAIGRAVSTGGAPDDSARTNLRITVDQQLVVGRYSARHLHCVGVDAEFLDGDLGGAFPRQ
jgi:hypothetical protein